MLETYRIGVKLSLINNVSRGLLLISRELGGLNSKFMVSQRHADELGRKMIRLGAIAAGGAGIAFGSFRMMEGPIKAAAAYTEELTYMRNQAGLTANEIHRIMTGATKLSTLVQTTSQLGGLKTIMDLRSIFGAGHLAMAISTAPAVAKAQAMLSQMGVRNSGAQAFNFAKALELLGHGRNQSDFVKHLNLMLQGMQAFHARILPKDWLRTVVYLRSSKYGFSDEFLYKYLPSFMLEYKGGASGGGARGPGNAIMSMIANVVNGQLSQRSFREWERLGLVNTASIYHVLGHGYAMGAGAIKDWKGFQSNPIAWTSAVLLPALKAHGITSKAKMLQTIAYLVPNRTSQDILDQIALQAWKLQRDRVNIDRATGLAGFNSLLATSPILAMKALNAQWFNVEKDLAFKTLPKLITAVDMLSKGLNRVDTFMTTHPALTKGVFLGLGSTFVLGTATSAISSIAMIVLALRSIGDVAKGGALATSLIGLSKAMLVFRWAAGVGAAGAVGWWAGGWLNSEINKGVGYLTHGNENTLGGWLYDELHSHHSHITVQIDGEDVRHRVMHGIKPGPIHGMTGVNPKEAPLSPSLNFAPGL